MRELKGPHVIAVDSVLCELVDEHVAVEEGHRDDVRDVHLSADHVQRRLGLPSAVCVGCVAYVDVDSLDLADVDLWPQLECGVDPRRAAIPWPSTALPRSVRSPSMPSSQVTSVHRDYGNHVLLEGSTSYVWPSSPGSSGLTTAGAAKPAWTRPDVRSPRPGVTFDWITFGARIHSTVHEFAPRARIGWYAETDQSMAYHAWLVEPRDARSTYVVVQETGTGVNPGKLADSNPGHMRRGHDL